MLFTLRELRSAVPKALSTALGLRPRWRTQEPGHSFSYTDRLRPVNDMIIFFCIFVDERRRIVCQLVCKQVSMRATVRNESEN